jgi:hypothetical protein
MGQLIPIRPETLDAVRESALLDQLNETTLQEGERICRDRGFHLVHTATVGFCQTCYGGIARDECEHHFAEVRLCRRCGLEEKSPS